jgi:hypothetical protein
LKDVLSLPLILLSTWLHKTRERWHVTCHTRLSYGHGVRRRCVVSKATSGHRFKT